MKSSRTQPDVFAFFEKNTWTFSYIVKDPESKACAIIDSVMDIDYPSGTVSYDSADAIIKSVNTMGLDVLWHIETHVHADHLSAAPYLKQKLGGLIAIGNQVPVVQNVFSKIFNTGDEFTADGSQFDHLFSDNETYNIGNLTGQAFSTPGHTPACMTHVIGDAAFIGDTMFMPDCGTARADFPGGDAATLYQSIHRILSLPDDTRLFMCHDYPPDDSRAVEYESSVAAEKAGNIHVRSGITEAEFVTMREARDRTMGMPTLILPSLQVNMRAGHLPPAEDNGMVYLKVPVNAFK